MKMFPVFSCGVPDKLAVTCGSMNIASAIFIVHKSVSIGDYVMYFPIFPLRFHFLLLKRS